MSGPDRLVLIYGGPSAEHEVSCVSALHVARAAEASGFELLIIGVSRRDRAWRDVTTTCDVKQNNIAFPSPDTVSGPTIDPVTFLSDLSIREPGTVVFPIIHGTLGEDGALQGLLEFCNIPYVGAGVRSSALCMDKAFAKAVLAQAGLPQPTYRVFRSPTLSESDSEDIDASLGYPCIVKPANMGSSVGVTKVGSSAGLSAALHTALAFDEVCLVETYVDGRELEVGVLGNGQDVTVSAVGEILPSEDIYSYDDKYNLGLAKTVVPARLAASQTEEIRNLAAESYLSLGVDGMARVDFFISGEDQILVSELNTIPGFTPISMFPMIWEEAGLDFLALVRKLVELGKQRHAKRSQLQTSAQ